MAAAARSHALFQTAVPRIILTGGIHGLHHKYPRTKGVTKGLHHPIVKPLLLGRWFIYGLPSEFCCFNWTRTTGPGMRWWQLSNRGNPPTIWGEEFTCRPFHWEVFHGFVFFFLPWAFLCNHDSLHDWGYLVLVPGYRFYSSELSLCSFGWTKGLGLGGMKTKINPRFWWQTWWYLMYTSRPAFWSSKSTAFPPFREDTLLKLSFRVSALTMSGSYCEPRGIFAFRGAVFGMQSRDHILLLKLAKKMKLPLGMDSVSI